MTKPQLPNKSQHPNSNHQTVWNLIIGYWLLFGAWYLVIGNSFASDSVHTIQSTYQSIQDFQADFIQETDIAVLEKKVKEPGRFMMKKPGMLRIEYTGEHPKQYISNGKKLWVVDSDQIETYKADSIPREALEFLKGFGEMETLFVVNGWKPKKRLQNHTYLRLVPKNAKAQYNWLDCEFGPDNILKKMTIHNKSGNISTYVFSNIQMNKGLNNNLFKEPI